MAASNSSETVHRGMSKIDRYKWKTGSKKGVYKEINKTDLSVDPAYQRETRQAAVAAIAAGFEWSAFGTLLVFTRGGNCFIVDGQHRWEAALRRSDVKTVPCLVFESAGAAAEAAAFIGANARRKPVTALERHRADRVIGDPIALEIDRMASEIGRVVGNASGSGHVRCVALLRKMLSNEKQKAALLAMWPTIAAASTFEPIYDRVVEGLVWLHQNIDGHDLSDKKWSSRIVDIGAKEMHLNACRAAQVYAWGGASVWGRGILDRINKGLRHKLTVLKNEGE